MEKIKETISNKLHYSKKEVVVEQDSGFEVLGLMKTRSRQNTGVLPEVTLARPNLERHISKIPQRDNDDGDIAEEDMPTELKRNISSIRQDDYDSDNESPPTNAAALDHRQQHISERTGSEFEESGVLRINTRDEQELDANTPIDQRPSIERHVSSIPNADEPKPNRRARLERTISQIPPNDYDSDDETVI